MPTAEDDVPPVNNVPGTGTPGMPEYWRVHPHCAYNSPRVAERCLLWVVLCGGWFATAPGTGLPAYLAHPPISGIISGGAEKQNAVEDHIWQLWDPRHGLLGFPAFFGYGFT